MSDAEKAFYLAQQVAHSPDQYPPLVAQFAVAFLLDPTSESAQEQFLEFYQQASTLKTVLVGDGLPYPPEEDHYYLPHERNQRGIVIGEEAIGGWSLKLFPDQLRRHCLVLGMTGSGKTNILQLIALGLGEIDR